MSACLRRFQRYTPSRLVGRRSLYHFDAVDDGTHADAQRAARAIVGDVRQVTFGVERDCLIAGIVAGHVAFAAIDAHLFVDESDGLLRIVEIVVRSNEGQSTSNDILSITYNENVLIHELLCYYVDF